MDICEMVDRLFDDGGWDPLKPSWCKEREYINNDIDGTKQIARVVKREVYMGIKKVIFHNPATIVYWADGSKTVVKATNEAYDPEKGLAMAISKRALGDKGNYYDVFKKHLKEVEK